MIIYKIYILNDMKNANVFLDHYTKQAKVNKKIFRSCLHIKTYFHLILSMNLKHCNIVLGYYSDAISTYEPK